MANILDLLLEKDADKLSTKVSTNLEIKRLSKILGEKFLVECRPITQEQSLYIAETSKSVSEEKYNTVIECIRIDGKKLNHKPLMEKFNAVTPRDVLSKLLLEGEIYSIYQKCLEVSGYSRNAVVEIKN